MRILVTGGAGYVGGFTARWLQKAGHEITVLDDLSSGHRAAVEFGTLVVGDVGDAQTVRKLLADCRAEAVIHFAASVQVGESVEQPSLYWRNNVANTLTLLEGMIEAGIRRFVFSSSAATYGPSDSETLREDAPTDPQSPYGATKLTIERIAHDFARAYGLGFAALRYFNACGASPDGAHGEDHSPESHLIPRLLRASLEGGEKFRLFGDDWSTADGSCVRDYVHVDDLAAAHQATLLACRDGQGRVYNVGTGRGHSVLEVIRSVERVTGSPVPCETAPRREGDVARLVACPDRLRQELAWEPAWRDLDSMVETAWAWHQRHPDGYGD
ncbi:MAG: UDP-glucose 4-epimerase GalE [Myxococcales bacterium]|nr:UDP-glucose 4-epimerase GalE [Myxococcales bacterium]